MFSAWNFACLSLSIHKRVNGMFNIVSQKFLPAFCIKLVVLSSFDNMIKFSNHMLVRVKLTMWMPVCDIIDLSSLNKQLKSDWIFLIRHQNMVHADTKHAFTLLCYASAAADDPTCVVSATLCGSSDAQSVVFLCCERGKALKCPEDCY